MWLWFGSRWSLVWAVSMLQAWCWVECDVWVWLEVVCGCGIGRVLFCWWVESVVGGLYVMGVMLGRV